MATKDLRGDLVSAFKQLAAGRPGAAEQIADLMLGTSEKQVAQASQQQQAKAGEVNGDESGQNYGHQDGSAMSQPVLHTYPDGSQRMGQPPFPEKSPLEEQAEAKRTGQPGARAQLPTPGQQTSGVSPFSVQPQKYYGTEESAKFAAEQQVTADVLSGKDPNTPNPTTSSDKPALAGTGNVIDGDSTALAPVAQPTAQDLKKIEAEPKGNIEATDEQKEGAAVQIARESTGVPGSTKGEAKDSKDSKTASKK